jgi:hypothetical protein
MKTSIIVTQQSVPTSGRLARIAVLVALAVSLSAPAYAKSRAPDLYKRNYRTIVADNHFRANYQNWKRGYPRFDWSNDGCSAPSLFASFSRLFHWPCVQHDFGYRNNRKVGLHNRATKAFVDGTFLGHMKQVCARQSGAARLRCNVAAGAFYTAVRSPASWPAW